MKQFLLPVVFLSIIGCSRSTDSSDEVSLVFERCKAQEVYWNSAAEPPSMDPNKQVDLVSGMWIGHLYEGLMSTDEIGNLVPGAAESFNVSADSKTYTFRLRKDAKWHDGEPVVAADFEFAFRRLVDPSYASEYSFFAVTAQILNAAKIIEKKDGKVPSDLGVKAIDANTLEIKLEGPNPIIPELVSFQIFFPVRKDIVERDKDTFNTKAANIVGNGPFKVAEWIKDQKMRLVKADTYWNASKIKLNAIEAPIIIRDNSAAYNQFVSSGLDMTGLDKERVQIAQKDNQKILSYDTGSTFYFELNQTQGKVFSNLKLRQALRIGINRNEYVNKIIGVPGVKPAFAIVPDFMPGSKGKYRTGLTKSGI